MAMNRKLRKALRARLDKRATKRTDPAQVKADDEALDHIAKGGKPRTKLEELLAEWVEDIDRG